MRILIVEDDMYQMDGVSEYLLRRGAEVKTAQDAASASQWVVEWQPEVVVLDLLIPFSKGMPRTEQEAHGLYLAKEFKRLYPRMGLVFHSAHVKFKEEILNLIKQYGGVAFLYKGEHPPAVLWDYIQQVHEGKVVLDEYLQGKPPSPRLSLLTREEQGMATIALSRMETLSKKQLEIVAKVAISHSYARIATDLHVEPSTINSYMSQIYNKLGLEKSMEEIIDRRAIITKVYQVYLEENNNHAL